MPSTTSIELLHRIKSGSDEPAWQQFLNVYGPFMESWLRFQGVDADLCRDIQQEVVLILLRDLEKFEHNGHRGAFRCWLRRITANQLRNFRRKFRDRNLVHLNGMADLLEDNQSELAVQWDREHNRMLVVSLLRQAAVDFNPQTVKAFELQVLNEQAPGEVADTLQMSRAAVITAKARVLRRLRERAIGLEFIE